MNNTKDEIMDRYHRGEISESQCWELLALLNQGRVSDMEYELTAPPSKVYEKLNDWELHAIEKLQGVGYGMNRSAKRFAHQIKDSQELTARQREFLRLLVWRYRRQLWKRDQDQKAKAYLDYMKAEVK